MCLMAYIGLNSPFVLNQSVSVKMKAESGETIRRHGASENLNTDQSNQFSREVFTTALLKNEQPKLSMY